MKIIIDTYFEETQSLIKELEASAQLLDIQTMTRVVHSLKSSSATIGAEQLSLLSKDLEQKYKAENTEDWEGDLEALSKLFEATQDVIKRKLAESDNESPSPDGNP